MFYILPFLFLTLFPSSWKNNRRKIGFIVEQIGRFVFGVVYYFLMFYLFLLDKNPIVMFSAFAFVLIPLLIWDGIRLQNDRMSVVVVGVGILFAFVWLFMAFIYPFTWSKEKYELVKGTTVSEPQESVDITHIPVVPLKYAQYKGDKLLGSIQNYSYYAIGEYTIQKIDNHLYWVAPVEYQGYFASRKAGYTPGYIKVDAENENAEAVLVDKYKMVYTASAYFSNDVMRHVRKQYPDLILMEASFEPMEDGTPTFAVTYGHYYKYRNVDVVDGVIIVNPMTGEMKKYSIKDMPAYVDQVFPGYVAEDYNHFFGELKLGFWNSLFAQTGVHVPTTWETGNEVTGVFDANGEFQWFTDHTTADSSGASMVGYSLMDGRSGKFVYYNGANGFLNGSAAIEVVNKSFVKENWIGDQPVLYQIYGEETWVIPVLDGNGLYRELAIVHAKSGDIVHDKDKNVAFNKYKSILAKNGGKGVPTNVSDAKQVNGTVSRISIGTEQVFVLLQNQQKIFVMDLGAFPYSRFIKEGDQLEVEYADNNEVQVTVTKLINNSLKR